MEEIMGCPIPVGFEVHHFDRNRGHNCPGNMQLLQECIHRAIRRFYRDPRDTLPWYTKQLEKQGVRKPRRKK